MSLLRLAAWIDQRLGLSSCIRQCPHCAGSPRAGHPTPRLINAAMDATTPGLDLLAKRNTSRASARPAVARAYQPSQAPPAAGAGADRDHGRHHGALSGGDRPRVPDVHRPRPAHPVSDPRAGRRHHLDQGGGAVFPERPGAAGRAAGDPRAAGPHVRPSGARRPGAAGARGAGAARRPLHHRRDDHPRCAHPHGQRHRRCGHGDRAGRLDAVSRLAAERDRRGAVSARRGADPAHRQAHPPRLGRHAGAPGRDRRDAERELRPGADGARLSAGGGGDARGPRPRSPSCIAR